MQHHGIHDSPQLVPARHQGGLFDFARGLQAPIQCLPKDAASAVKGGYPDQGGPYG